MSADFSTISEAVAAAGEGDTILVYDGYYAEGQINVFTNGLVLVAAGNVTINVLGQSVGFNILADNVSVSGFVVQNVTSRGIDLKGRGNTITNNTITNSYSGIRFINSLNNTINTNNVKNNIEYGIVLNNSSNNTITHNTITAKKRYHPGDGISIINSSDCNITQNNIIDNWDGITLSEVSATTISFNNITTNGMTGMYVGLSSGNVIFNNNFVDNAEQVYVYNSVNSWDGGYPSGGNYWSDYNGVDVYSGLLQDESGSDGMGDTPYVIDGENQHNYPLMKPYPWSLPLETPQSSRLFGTQQTGRKALTT